MFAWLLQVQALLVASHYKNTPNDLLLLADAPAHQLYVLLGPVDETQNALPDVLAVVQVGGSFLTILAVYMLLRGCSWITPTCSTIVPVAASFIRLGCNAWGESPNASGLQDCTFIPYPTVL